MDKIIINKIRNQGNSESEKFNIVWNKSGLMGVTNEHGKLVIDFKFRNIENFKCGLALVNIRIDEQVKYGYLRPSGYLSWLKKRYSRVYSFSEGLAIVYSFYEYDRQMYGFIDLNLNEVIPSIYYGANSFESGLAAVSNKQYWGFIDTNGNQVIPFKYVLVKDFTNDLAAVALGDYDIYKWGYIDKNGKEVIPCKYKNADSFSEGLAAVGNKIESGDFKYGYINANGDIVISLQYEKAEPFSENLAAVSLDYYTYFFIDKNGKQRTPALECDWVGLFKNGFAKFGVGDFNHMKYGVIDKSGRIIFDPIYTNIFILEDYFIVDERKNIAHNASWSMFDKLGNKITSSSYHNIFSFVEGFATVRRYKKKNQDMDFDYNQPLYSFLDQKGKELVPCIYEDILEFRDGIGAIKQNGKWGFVNSAGYIFGLEYDDICLYNSKGNIYSISSYCKLLNVLQDMPDNLKFFVDNIAFVIKNNKYGMIDLHGNEVAPCIYEDLDPTERLKSNDIFIYKKHGKYGFINRKGKEISSPIYSIVLHFSDGMAACCKDGKWGFINELGNVVIPFKYFDVSSFHCGLAPVNINDLWGYINKSDKIVIKPQFQIAKSFIHHEDGTTEAEVWKWDGKSPNSDGYIIDTKGKIIESF